jgi:hypothetical protein
VGTVLYLFVSFFPVFLILLAPVVLSQELSLGVRTCQKLAEVEAIDGRSDAALIVDFFPLTRPQSSHNATTLYFSHQLVVPGSFPGGRGVSESPIST